MREFLLSIIGVVVISLIVEVVFPTKRMRGAVTLGFSLAVVFILVGGIKTVFGSESLNFNEIMWESDNEEFLNQTIEQMESQLKTHLIKLGFDVTKVEVLTSENNAFQFDRVEVYVLGEVDEEKLKDKLLEIIEVKRDDVWVRN